MKKTFLISAILISGFLFGCVSHTEHAPAEVKEYSKIIAARLYIQPDHVAEFIELFQGLVELTLQEPGCTRYELFQDPLDPTKFLVYEIYVDQAAVEAHFAAPYFAEYVEKIGELASKPAEIVVYDVAGETRP